MGLGFIDDPAVTQTAAEVTARQALAMGIHWLFSPCVDVNLCPQNPIIGIRSFGETPELVARMGRAFIEGCRAAGTLCTAKHFPGTGNVTVDSHVGFSADAGDEKTWVEKTLPPFQTAIEAGAPCVMTGHVIMPFLDPSGLPATYSHTILSDVLRQRLGFKGVIISDHLGMGGAGVGDSVAQRCLDAFLAGCDILLTPFDEEIVPAFEQAVKQGRISLARLEASVERAAAARQAVASSSGSLSVEDTAVAAQVGQQAARILRGGPALPLHAGEMACLIQWRDDEAQYFPREPGVLARLQSEIRWVDPSAPVGALTRDCPESEHERAIKTVGARKVVVLAAIVKNYAADPYGGRLSVGTRALARKLAALGKDVVLVVLGTPYIAADLPEVRAVICSAGDTVGSVKGILDKLFGARP